MSQHDGAWQHVYVVIKPHFRHVFTLESKKQNLICTLRYSDIFISSMTGLYLLDVSANARCFGLNALNMTRLYFLDVSTLSQYDKTRHSERAIATEESKNRG